MIKWDSMNLSIVFDEAFKHAEELCKLYNGLSSKNTRAAKSDWTQKVYKNKIIRWPKRDDLWRSFGTSLLILGNKKQSDNKFCYKNPRSRNSS